MLLATDGSDWVINMKLQNNVLVHVLAAVLILGLLLCTVYFIAKDNQPQYRILIGTSVEGTSDAVDFQEGKPLHEKDVDTVIFSMVYAQSIEKPDVANTTPDAVIYIGKANTNIAQATLTLWLNGSSIIFTTDPDDSSSYKTTSSFYASALQELILSQINT